MKDEFELDVRTNIEAEKLTLTIEQVINELDARISAQLDEILHHDKFQMLEALWRGLYFLVERTDFDKNIGIDLVDVSKTALANDFNQLPLLESGLFQKVLTTPKAGTRFKPYAAIIANYYS